VGHATSAFGIKDYSASLSDAFAQQFAGAFIDWIANVAHAALRCNCSPVDEPIQGSTPALRHP